MDALTVVVDRSCLQKALIITPFSIFLPQYLLNPEFGMLYEILYFISISVKRINCRMKDFQKKCVLLTDKLIHRGASLLQTNIP